MMTKQIAMALFVGLVFFHVPPADATTKGLNQIVTPDIQPLRTLSVSLQVQDAAIGPELEKQLEIGVARGFEVAVFRGIQPGQTLLHCEASLVDRHPWLLSTGLLNWDPCGAGVQPFLEGGYYNGRAQCILGAQRIGTGIQPIAGFAWTLNPHLSVQTDHIGGVDNFTTIGFTYYASSSFSLNPALYVANGSGHAARGYLVATYTMKF